MPEGNQVTVTLPGWKTTASFFISSTNRHLTINLTYALPDSRNSLQSLGWQGCECGAGSQVRASYTAMMPANAAGYRITVSGNYTTDYYRATRGCNIIPCSDPATRIGTVPFEVTHGATVTLPDLTVILRYCNGSLGYATPVSVALTSLRVAAPNDVNQWTHYTFDPRLADTRPLNGIPNLGNTCP